MALPVIVNPRIGFLDLFLFYMSHIPVVGELGKLKKGKYFVTLSSTQRPACPGAEEYSRAVWLRRTLGLRISGTTRGPLVGTYVLLHSNLGSYSRARLQGLHRRREGSPAAHSQRAPGTLRRSLRLTYSLVIAKNERMVLRIGPPPETPN